MSDEEELQGRLGNRQPNGLLPHPEPGEKRRLASMPCLNHGLDPDCGCTETIDVGLDLYHLSVLYPGLLAKALKMYFINHAELLMEDGEITPETNNDLNRWAGEVL